MLTHYETQRLILEVCTPDMAGETLRFYKANQAIFQPYDPIPPSNYYTEEYQYNSLICDFNAYLEKKGVRFYLFEKKNPQHIIGTISFSNIMHGFLQSTVIGYKLDSQYHHQGYAYEALQKGIDIMFREEKLHRISAFIMPSNTASIKLVERLCFTYEGTALEYACIQGKWEDHRIYSLLNHI